MPPDTGFAVVRVTSADDACWDDLLRIYRLAFTASERIAERHIRETVHTGKRRLYRSTHAGGITTGLASCLPLTPAPATLLEYFAVDETMRSRGVGSLLLQAVLTAEADIERVPLVMELEDPAEPGIADEERHLRRRRVRFYSRCGSAPLSGEIGYRPPSFTSEPAPALHLYEIAADDVQRIANFEAAAAVLSEIARSAYPAVGS